HGHAQQQGAGPGQELLGRPPIGPQLPRPHGQGRDQRRAQSRSVGRRRKDLFQASVRGTSRPSRAPQPTTATDPAVTATHTNTTVIAIPVTKISVSGASVSVTVPSTSTGPIPGRSSATTRTAGASGTACAARSGHRRRK